MWHMTKAPLVAGLLLGAGIATAASAGEPVLPPSRSILMELTNRPLESPEQALKEAIKADAQAPGPPSALEMWEPQPDGSMRHKKTGISVVVRNPCPPGDLQHEDALAAYNRALARSKSRR
jgi:hypothetical protein